MKYKLSELKHKLDELGVFGIEFLPMVQNNHTNAVDLCAKQWIAGTEIKHKVQALTFDNALSTLLLRAELFRAAMDEVKPSAFEQPDIGTRNMVGHLNNGNVEFVKDIVMTRPTKEVIK